MDSSRILPCAEQVADRVPGGAAYDGGMENIWTAIAWSIIPTIAVCVVFFFVLRGILRFDRTERKVHAQIEAEERAARGLPPRTP